MVDTEGMCRKAFILLSLFAVAPLVFADEKLALLKAGNDVYTNVTVMTITPTDVYFTYAHGNGIGMANAKLKSLDSDLQKHFHYDPAKASEAEQKQADANAQYHLQVASQPAAHPPNEDRDLQASTAGTSSELSWGTDLPAAINQASSENKMVLLNFTGSDWCGWCMKFDHDVLSTGQFADYAKSKLVLVQLDFPNVKPQSDELKRNNQDLKRKYSVNGYPTFVLLNSDGNEIGRQLGYSKGGPDAFIAKLENFAKK